MHLWRFLSPYFIPYVPTRLGRFLAACIPHKNAQKLRSIVTEMHEQTSNIYNQKKLAIAKGDSAVVEQIGEGKDIMSILSPSLEYFPSIGCANGSIVKANMEANDEDKLPDEEVLAQMSYVSSLVYVTAILIMTASEHLCLRLQTLHLMRSLELST